MLLGRHHRVKNEFRFISFILICIIILIMGTAQLMGNNQASASSADSFKTVVVASGDSLWSIASLNKEAKTDIRKAVYKIQKINKVEPGQLRVGMEILIPEKL